MKRSNLKLQEIQSSLQDYLNKMFASLSHTLKNSIDNLFERMLNLYQGIEEKTNQLSEKVNNIKNIKVGINKMFHDLNLLSSSLENNQQSRETVNQYFGEDMEQQICRRNKANSQKEKQRQSQNPLLSDRKVIRRLNKRNFQKQNHESQMNLKNAKYMKVPNKKSYLSNLQPQNYDKI